ncbi:MAG: VWA domain-containing protein [Pseudomonadota bacterium]
MPRRREAEEFSLSFLDVICCGFGAIILLLMITKTAEPIVLEESVVDLEGQIVAREQQLFEIRGQVQQLERQTDDTERALDERLAELSLKKDEASTIRGQYATTKEEIDEALTGLEKLAAARQSLTEEMERLLGQGFKRSSETIGGIPVDSEYIIFVIDTSGSMQQFAWGAVMRKVSETLQIYPTVKGIQVMSDMGDFMFPTFRDRWIPDSPQRRRSIIERMRNWAPFSNSSPVEGIEKAVSTFWAPDKRISVYVFGDDYTGRSIEQVVDTIDRINRADASGRRRVRIHAVGFPVYLRRPGSRAFRFAALMRELAYRNDGTFVGLPSL